jgi:hypothetical protein
LLNEFLKEHRKVQTLEAALAAVNERLKAQDAKIDIEGGLAMKRRIIWSRALRPFSRRRWLIDFQSANNTRKAKPTKLSHRDQNQPSKSKTFG